MSKRKADKVTDAVQEAPVEGAEHANHLAQISTDATEYATREEMEIVPHNVDVTEALQDATREDTEQAGRITQISTDASERAARAGTEILQRNAETVRKPCSRAPRLRHA